MGLTIQQLDFLVNLILTSHIKLCVRSDIGLDLCIQSTSEDTDKKGPYEPQCGSRLLRNFTTSNYVEESIC